jgi:heme a synthase
LRYRQTTNSANHSADWPQMRLKVLTVFTLFLTFDLVVFGAFTRLTDSGLGCPDWPGCYGSASPLGASAAITAAQLSLPTGPVTHSKAWVEMIHRYMATGVGALILALTVLSWRAARKQPRHPLGQMQISPWWPTVTLVWVCLQGAFGALTVTLKLYPTIVTAHLLGGLMLLVLLAIQAQGYTRKPLVLSSGLHRAAVVIALLSAIQIALGGWVSTNYAVLACRDFPMCQGSWWPEMNWAHGYALWRYLGVDADGAALPFEALTAIHYAHRLSAYVVLGAMMLFAWRLFVSEVRTNSGKNALQPWAWAVIGVCVWQFASGLSNVVLGWPLLGAVAHTTGAAAWVVLLTTLLTRARPSYLAAIPPSAGSAQHAP